MIAATDCDTSEIVVKDNSIGVETDVNDVTYVTIAIKVYIDIKHLLRNNSYKNTDTDHTLWRIS